MTDISVGRLNRLRRLSGLVLACIVLGAGVNLGAQAGTAVRRVQSGPTCSTCQLHFDQILEFQIEDSPLSDRPTGIARTGDGAYLLAEFRQLPRLFTSGGRYEREVGTLGRGPGELIGVSGFTPLPGDSLLAHELEDRITLLDPRFVPKRTYRLPGDVASAVVLSWPDRVVVSGSLPSASSAGLPLHILNFSGETSEVTRSLGWGSPSDPYAPRHLLARSRAGGFWSADPLEYRFVKWTNAGDIAASYSRTPTWFSTRSPSGIGSPTTPPPPSIAALHEDEEGLLWVYLRRPARDWRSGWPQLPSGVVEVAVRDLRADVLFDVVVEVIDPVAGRVVARHDSAVPVTAVLPNGDLLAAATGADGSLSLAVYRPRLSRR